MRKAYARCLEQIVSDKNFPMEAKAYESTGGAFPSNALCAMALRPRKFSPPAGTSGA